jgi:hypothetical protein
MVETPDLTIPSELKPFNRGDRDGSGDGPMPHPPPDAPVSMEHGAGAAAAPPCAVGGPVGTETAVGTQVRFA